jgi:predicted amidohydrolase YtcJ
MPPVSALHEREIVLYNGHFLTMDRRSPRAAALWARGNRIAAVGSSEAILDLASADAPRVDLGSRAVVPGFQDAHLHLTAYGLQLQRVDLSGAATLEEALERIRRRQVARPGSGWLLGSGWNHNLWPGGRRPTRHDLDRVVGDRPAAFDSKDGHSLWVSSAALRAAGISPDTPDPAGGQILRDERGELAGIVTERAQKLVATHIPKPDAAALREAARAAMAHATRLGITGIHNCEEPSALAAFQRLDEAGQLTLRVWHMIAHDHLPAALELGLKSGFGSPRLRVGHLKMFADGALGSGTAEMLAPYEGRPDDYGVAATPSEALYASARAAALGGISSAIHAIGDAANRRVLDVYARLRGEGIKAQIPHRIEHVQLLAPDDLPRLAQLGVIASMQPIHATQDMRMADRQWGERARLAYAWRSLLRSGATLAFGTDCPVEALDPLANLYAATTRRAPGGIPQGGWYPEQRLSLDEALYAYTMGPALATGQSHRQGSLTPGKYADLAVLSFRGAELAPEALRGAELAPEALLGARVDLTIFDGRVILDREGQIPS